MYRTSFSTSFSTFGIFYWGGAQSAGLNRSVSKSATGLG